MLRFGCLVLLIAFGPAHATEDANDGVDAEMASATSVDLMAESERMGLTPVTQGDRPVCSIFAITALADFELAKHLSTPQPRLSEAYLIWAANEATGAEGESAMFYEAVHGLNALGVCDSALMPFSSQAMEMEQPTPAALADARTRAERWEVHWIRRWNIACPLSDSELLGIKAALAAGHPVACGLRWPKAQNGSALVEVPPADGVFDGHSIVLVGYSDDTIAPGGGTFTFRNSNGESWGTRGYGTMSYAYVRAYANDALWLGLEPADAERPLQRSEAESLAVTARERCETLPQAMKPWGELMWGGGTQLFCRAERDGFVELSFEVSTAGDYRLRVQATAAPDYGRVRVSLDGEALPGEFDLYSGQVCPSGPLELGTQHLSVGPHRLRLESAGKNTASSNYYFGIDSVELLPPKLPVR